MEPDAQSPTLHHVKLTDKHLGERRIYQVAVGLAGRRWRLSESHRRLQLERRNRRRKELGGSDHVIHQTSILQLWQALTNTVPLRPRHTGLLLPLWQTAGGFYTCAIKYTVCGMMGKSFVVLETNQWLMKSWTDRWWLLSSPLTWCTCSMSTCTNVEIMQLWRSKHLEINVLKGMTLPHLFDVFWLFK